MIVFTSICANYAHKARTLAQSVKRAMPDAKFFVCLVEREVPAAILTTYFDQVILAKDTWEGNFDRFIFKHSIVEASTAVKGQFLKYLLDQYPDETEFIYLDPDCYVYSDFVELKQHLTQKPIILCPHLLKPGNIDMELSSTAHGVYNLGFLAINHSEEAVAFANWWAERLYLFCYDDIQRGIFTDQKWIDLVPCFFDAHVFKHHGYDFAPWALYHSTIRKDQDAYFIDGDPLRFIHFSGFGKVAERCMSNWLDKDNQLFRELYDDYAAKHNSNDEDSVSGSKWSYACYHDGMPVNDKIRAKYRSNYDVMFAQENPFALSDCYFAKVFRKKEPKTSFGHKLMHYASRAGSILQTDGIYGVLKKTKQKIFG